MSGARHVYEVYIKAAPEQVWQAITDPDFTRRYFHGTAIESTFETGAPLRYVLADAATAVVGTVEVFEPPTRLVMTWSFQYRPELAAEPPSRVSWLIALMGDGLTRLVVEHGDLAKSPITWTHVEHGWHWVLDGLKTLLETGASLPAIASEAAEPPTADPEGEWHRSLRVAAHNATWNGSPSRPPNGRPTTTRS